MKNILELSQAIGLTVLYLLIVFLPPAFKAFELFNPAYTVDEDDVLTYSLFVNVIQAIIAIVVIVIYTRRFR